MAATDKKKQGTIISAVFLAIVLIASGILAYRILFVNSGDLETRMHEAFAEDVEFALQSPGLREADADALERLRSATLNPNLNHLGMTLAYATLEAVLNDGVMTEEERADVDHVRDFLERSPNARITQISEVLQELPRVRQRFEQLATNLGG